MKEKSGVIHVIEQPNALNDVHIYSAFKAFTRSCTGVKMLARLPQNQQSGGSSSGWFGRTTTTDQNVNTLKDEEEGESRLQFFLVAIGTDIEETQTPDQSEQGGRKKQSNTTPVLTNANVKPLVKIFSVVKQRSGPSQFVEKHRYPLLPNETNTGVREVITEDKTNAVSRICVQSLTI
jgi:hypothetical protein